MKTIFNASEFDKTKGIALTIGSFDGIHKGHVCLIKNLIKQAQSRNLLSAVLTFSPHPREVLGKNNKIPRLTSLKEKQYLLSEIGLDYLIVHPFTKEFSSLSPREYVRDVLVESLNTKFILVGHNHRFGKKGAAGFDDLVQFGEDYGFEAAQQEMMEINGMNASSTLIRKLVAEGNIADGNSYLGYEYKFSSTLCKPTVELVNNTLITDIIKNNPDKVLPPVGSYEAKVKSNDLEYSGTLFINENGELRVRLQSLDFDPEMMETRVVIQLCNQDENFVNIFDTIRFMVG